MKGTLKLKPRDPEGGDGLPEEESSGLEVDVMDLRLPCRLFEISYQVAEAGRFTLATEFLLRLLKSVNGLMEVEIAEFFGFSTDETAHVVSAAERKELVFRSGGRVTLTEAGDALFDKSAHEPELYEVERKTGWFWFDLVSFCPIRADHLQSFEKTLPEVPLRNAELAANASAEVRKAFRKHFHELQVMHGAHIGEKSIPYTVDATIGQQRSSALIPVSVRMRRDAPGTVEPDLLGWKSGVDLDSRIDVLESCGAFLRTYLVPTAFGSDGGVEYLKRCAPTYVERFFRAGKFDSWSYFRRASVLAGDLRKDRKTARIFGTLWTPRNRARLAAAIQHSPPLSSTEGGPIIWFRPAVAHWGCSTTFVSFLDSLAKSMLAVDSAEPVRKVLISHEDQETRWRFGEAFDVIAVLRERRLPKNFELLLLPGRVFAALVYTPLVAGGGYPMPLGVVSFDPDFLRLAHDVMSDVVADGLPAGTGHSLKTDLVDDLLDILKLPENYPAIAPAEPPRN